MSNNVAHLKSIGKDVEKLKRETSFWVDWSHIISNALNATKITAGSINATQIRNVNIRVDVNDGRLVWNEQQ